MPHPNAVLPCGTASARRRHIALAQRCRQCEAVSTSHADDLDAHARHMTNRNITLQATNARLRADLAAVADWAGLLADNQAMAAQLADVDRTFKTFLRSRYLSHDVVDREHRRLFPRHSEGAAA